MGQQSGNDKQTEKKSNPVDRDLTTGLFLLRCIEVGLTLADLEDIEMGMALDILTEKANDDCDYDKIATQDDFDRI